MKHKHAINLSAFHTISAGTVFILPTYIYIHKAQNSYVYLRFQVRKLEYIFLFRNPSSEEVQSKTNVPILGTDECSDKTNRMLQFLYFQFSHSNIFEWVWCSQITHSHTKNHQVELFLGYLYNPNWLFYSYQITNQSPPSIPTAPAFRN